MFKHIRKEKHKVLVAMSGGVDSSVAAALLKEQGHEVIGVFLYFWAEKVQGRTKDNVCCSLESQEEARKVAQQLGIPFYTLNLEASFKEKIVDDFLRGYQCGATPNPCVQCNRFIKFGELLIKMKQWGVDYLATGHYAQVKKDRHGVYNLYRGKDVNKDQSYFLYKLTQPQLRKLIFPVGHLTKPEVRKLAEKFKLSVAKRQESQEICFIPDGNTQGFLGRYLQVEEGLIIDFKTKEVLGKHKGFPFYTLGQRKGLGLAGGPWYVVNMDVVNNVLWVSTDEADLLKKECHIHSINWLNGHKPKLKFKGLAQIRYQDRPTKVKVLAETNKRFLVKFKQSKRAITPGQSLVFYDKNRCLGGGIIDFFK